MQFPLRMSQNPHMTFEPNQYLYFKTGSTSHKSKLIFFHQISSYHKLSFLKNRREREREEKKSTKNEISLLFLFFDQVVPKIESTSTLREKPPQSLRNFYPEGPSLSKLFFLEPMKINK